jgi:hypothetical protein
MGPIRKDGPHTGSLTASERADVQQDLNELYRDRQEMLGRATIGTQQAWKSRQAWLHRNQREIDRVKGLLAS